MRYSKRVIQGDEGDITAYAFLLCNTLWVVARSETKWHAGEKYRRAPIWMSVIKQPHRDIPALFIGKTAIGYERKKPKQ